MKLPTDRDWWLRVGFRAAYDLITFPIAVAAVFLSPRIHPAYEMTWAKKFSLGWRMYRNQFRVLTGTSWRAHLAMASKLLEMGPEVPGCVVECGCFKGGSTANLSLICDIVDRDLIVYDSFEGLPPPAEGEKRGSAEWEGSFAGSLDTVRENVRSAGVLDRCTFRKGWLKDTLPDHEGPIALAFFDVDYQDSLHECVINLWPHVVYGGHVFVDEYVQVDNCALWFSERYWQTYFDTKPPGLYGSGTGIGLGQYCTGPFMLLPPLQAPQSVAFTFKGSDGSWDYYPDAGG